MRAFLNRLTLEAVDRGELTNVLDVSVDGAIGQ